MSFPLEGLPPVDKSSLEAMREIFVWGVATLGLTGVAYKKFISSLKRWADDNRHDQKNGLIHPKKGKPTYTKNVR